VNAELLEPIDLHFRGLRHAIGVYVLETADGLALVDCGPTTTLPRLREGLSERGLELAEFDHLLLSHIHLDHAGAAGTIVRAHPKLRVWVSERGMRHLIDPSRLESSARRLYGDRFDQLFGELAPVPAGNVELADGELLGLEAFASPGHASHHVCYQADEVLFAGDACGVRNPADDCVLPVSPPPDIDVELWHATIDAVAARQPKLLALTHFGLVSDVDRHLALLGSELDRWAALVAAGADVEAFAAAARPARCVDPALYDAIAPFDQSWQGLRRYLDKRAERSVGA
jgi:glyoxylase-like metal-dependent hydrolase (beta-lactamase superfamily II)